MKKKKNKDINISEQWELLKAYNINQSNIAYDRFIKILSGIKDLIQYKSDLILLLKEEEFTEEDLIKINDKFDNKADDIIKKLNEIISVNNKE